jgi:hypothetical protein
MRRISRSEPNSPTSANFAAYNQNLLGASPDREHLAERYETFSH